MKIKKPFAEQLVEDTEPSEDEDYVKFEDVWGKNLPPRFSKELIDKCVRSLDGELKMKKESKDDCLEFFDRHIGGGNKIFLVKTDGTKLIIAYWDSKIYEFKNGKFVLFTSTTLNA